MADYQYDSGSGMVTGLFSDRASAERAYQALPERGYSKDDVNLIMSDDTRKRHFSDTGDATELGSKAAEGAGIGAGIGGALGAAVAAVAAVGTSIAVPGLGLVIAGPLAAAIAGAGAGGVTGGLLGALVGSGIPEERVREYEKGIEGGGILMGVSPRSREDAEHFEKHWKENSGQHVVGTSIGVGAGALAGGAIGAAAGPVGMAAGAAVGAVAGGLAGNGTAAIVNPSAEDRYWRDAYLSEPYAASDRTYDDYGPAYSVGYNGRAKYSQSFEDAEESLSRDWEESKGKSRLDWQEARQASKAAWTRVDMATSNKEGKMPVYEGNI
jgi:hypothetical protein